MKNIIEDQLDTIEMVVDKAHEICGEMLLFQAISMEKQEVRLFLASQSITDHTTQDRYLKLVDSDDRLTGGKWSVDKSTTNQAMLIIRKNS